MMASDNGVFASAAIDCRDRPTLIDVISLTSQGIVPPKSPTSKEKETFNRQRAPLMTMIPSAPQDSMAFIMPTLLNPNQTACRIKGKTKSIRPREPSDEIYQVRNVKQFTLPTRFGASLAALCFGRPDGSLSRAQVALAVFEFSIGAMNFIM
jgi:hypothetical protein